LIAERTPEGEYAVHPELMKEVEADKGITVTMGWLDLPKWEYDLTLPSQLAGRATGTANRRRSKWYMAIGAAFRAPEASGCSGNGASGS
jgi:hypothetical protein